MILFMERNTTILQILNMKIVTSEIIKIIIGSIGLVVVAPITTYIASFIYSLEVKNSKNKILKLLGIFLKKNSKKFKISL